MAFRHFHFQCSLEPGVEASKDENGYPDISKLAGRLGVSLGGSSGQFPYL